jgi:uncharacterized protein
MLQKCIMRVAIVTSFSLTINFAGHTSNKIEFKAVAFYTARHDPSHVSFVREANAWFERQAQANNFAYDTTSNWKNLNTSFLSRYQVVIFLDTRPEIKAQREAFEKYVKGGGAWLGFHFAAFALKDSEYPDNWPWYHDEFIGAGQYKSNTWRPTAETLGVDAPDHPACKGLPQVFESSPNEWYCWEKDLRMVLLGKRSAPQLEYRNHIITPSINISGRDRSQRTRNLAFGILSCRMDK